MKSKVSCKSARSRRYKAHICSAPANLSPCGEQGKGFSDIRRSGINPPLESSEAIPVRREGAQHSCIRGKPAVPPRLPRKSRSKRSGADARPARWAKQNGACNGDEMTRRREYRTIRRMPFRAGGRDTWPANTRATAKQRGHGRQKSDRFSACLSF